MLSPKRVLPKDVKKVMKVLIRNLVPQPEDLHLNNIEESVIFNAGRMVFEFPPLFRRSFVWAVRFFEWTPLLFGFGLSRFSHLSEKKQLKYVDNWALSCSVVKREIFKVLKGLIMIVYFSDKRVWSYIGYDPAPHMAERIQMRENIIAQEQTERTSDS